MPGDNGVRFSLEISAELCEELQELAREAQVTFADILRRALFLARIAAKAAREGDRLQVIDSNQEVIANITWR
jgi:predicted transcriptional regulator